MFGEGGKPLTRMSTPREVRSLALADLDSDGCHDIVAGLTDGFMVVWGKLRPGEKPLVKYPPRRQVGEGFGSSVAAYKNTLVVGAPNDDPHAPGSGVVYVYTFTGHRPGPPKRITQNSPGVVGNSEKNDNFGWAVAAGDFGGGPGVDIVVGAPGESTDGPGASPATTEDTARVSGVPNAGAVTVLFDPLTARPRSTKFVHAQGRTAGARFGHSLAVGNRDDESYLLAGVPGADAVEVISLNGEPRPYSTLTSPKRGVMFGHSLALADGRAVVGAPRADGARGNVSIHLLDPGAPPRIVQPQGRPGDRFGWAVTVGPGLRVTASAPGRRAPEALAHRAGSGAITHFRLDDPRPGPWWYPPTPDVRFGEVVR